MRLQVLTTGSWPGETAQKCCLPRELEKACQSFQAFYLQAYSGRRLTWQTNKGHAGEGRLGISLDMLPPSSPTCNLNGSLSALCLRSCSKEATKIIFSGLTKAKRICEISSLCTIAL